MALWFMKSIEIVDIIGGVRCSLVEYVDTASDVLVAFVAQTGVVRRSAMWFPRTFFLLSPPL